MIERVKLHIPWGKLNTEATKLQLEGLHLLVGPQSESAWDAEAEEQRVMERKLALLAAKEGKLLQQSKKEEPAHGSGWMTRLMASVLERLQARAPPCSSSSCSSCSLSLAHVASASPRLRPSSTAGRGDRRDAPLRRQLARRHSLLHLLPPRVDHSALHRARA